jgi:CubicO group peptidase (beta-lactamase class C family)
MGDVQWADVQGTVEPGFEGVREAFERNFAEHGEVGAACALYVGGRPVVDLWGGVADAATDQPYGEDTLQLVFSSTKGATALCANLLAQRGHLDVDAPVARYWPEFAQAGKDEVPVRWLLSHQAGLSHIDRSLTLEEALAWDPPVEALAAQAPIWEPGTAHGYHAVTFGWLVGEVVRRITGRSLGTFFAEEVAGPLGLEFWIGLPDEHQGRVAPLTNRGVRHGDQHPEEAAGMEAEGARTLAEVIEQFLGPDSLLAKALGGVDGVFTAEGVFNRPEVRAAELPAANGVANARSMARMYAGAIGRVEGGDAGPLLTPQQIAAASTRLTSGADKVLMIDTTFGLGFMTASPFAPYGGATSFGHAGAGGSVGFADPENDIGFGYVMNRMLANLSGDPRSRGLIAAVYDAIGVRPAFV